MKILACIALVVFMVMMVILGLSVSMSDSYNLLTENLWGILSVVNIIMGSLIAAFFWLKINLPKMAKENRCYFMGLETNMITATWKGKKRVAFFGDLSGENSRVDRLTGKIEKGGDVELNNSFLWKYGAVWMGLGNEVEKTISLWNTHEFKIERAETEEGAEIDISVRFVTRVVDARITMNYEDIKVMMQKRMKSEFLKVLGKKQLKDILKSKSGSDKDKGDSLWTNLLVNDDEMRKTLDLELIFGQKLYELSVIDFNICDPEVRKLYFADELQIEINKRKMEEVAGENDLKIKIAEGDAAAKKIAAEAALKVAETETARIKVLDGAKLDKLQKVKDVLDTEGATRLAVSEALAGFQGNVLSLGAEVLFASDGEKRGKKK